MKMQHTTAYGIQLKQRLGGILQLSVLALLEKKIADQEPNLLSWHTGKKIELNLK